ncbi:DUF2860 family protein [Aeromonas australiensis]|uniref:DUF2860 family protein n=1 Tax=Aeromonas australiensis TaxID=1114880 RepID=UPI00058A45EB|nr:DUF2860 family protein [Aeromonas australiensis]
MRHLSLFSLALLVANSAHADLGSIPKESGWSGFLLGGINVVNYKSNFYSGDDDNNTLATLGSPPSSSALAPLINADIRYTFADTRTQLFLGNLIQDAIRFDFTQQLGVRQELGDKGIVGGSFVFSAMPTKQWSDPFAVGVARSSTDIKSAGARVSWDKVWGSNFNASLTSRNIDVDEERSGQQYDAAHSTSYAPLLDRNGKINALELSYQWRFAPGQVLEPALVYRDADLDGRAQRYKQSGMQLTYGKRGAQWSLVSNLYLGQSSYDEANPLFGQYADANEFAVNAIFFWHKLFGVRALSATASAAYAQSSSDISFYDSQATRFSTGLLYNF